MGISPSSAGGLGGIGQFVGWDGGCLLIGRAVGIVPLHAHYAIQVAISSEPGVRFRSNEDEEWTEYAGAMIPSQQPHSMDASRVPANAIIFVEPETREGRALAELYLTKGIASIPEERIAAAREDLFSTWRSTPDRKALADAARRVIHALTGGVEPRVASDERILRVTAYIRDHLDEQLTLDNLAALANLSSSRFRHLFVEQTGMGLRPYILWRRFLRVWELLMAGETLSSAAHGAGFADSAHLTRTSRRMFGIPPSALVLSREGPN